MEQYSGELFLPDELLTRREATPGDRDHLVRAVSAVVLQRDVSLSRRVYTWFLSADESAQNQGEYFRKHGLEPLSSTLQVCLEVYGCTDMTE